MANLHLHVPADLQGRVLSEEGPRDGPLLLVGHARRTELRKGTRLRASARRRTDEGRSEDPLDHEWRYCRPSTEVVRRMRSGRGDRIFAGGVTGLALIVPLTLAGITLLMVEAAWPSITTYGLGFLTSSTWDPVKEIFGAGAYLYGTIVTTAIAVVIAAPVAVGAAIFLVEYAPKRVAGTLSFLIEVLAYIPSIVYGLWGLFVLVPLFRENAEPFLQATLGRIPIIGALFDGPVGGRDLLVGGVILAIMILPLLVAVSREVIAAVPIAQREGMLGIGATKWEMVRGAV